MSKPFAKITNSEPCIIMLLEKLQKNDWSLDWFAVSIFATYVQGSAMAAMEEWRNCSSLTCALLDHAIG